MRVLADVTMVDSVSVLLGHRIYTHGVVYCDAELLHIVFIAVVVASLSSSHMTIFLVSSTSISAIALV